MFYRAKLQTITVRVRTPLVSSGGDVLEISNVFIHPNFDKYVYFNDIALIKVRVFVEINSNANVFDRIYRR